MNIQQLILNNRAEAKSAGCIQRANKKDNLILIVTLLLAWTVRGKDEIPTGEIVRAMNQTTVNVLRYLHILKKIGIVDCRNIGTQGGPYGWRLNKFSSPVHSIVSL